MGDFPSRNWYILFNVKISRSSENLHRVYSPICNKLSLSFSDAVRRCRTTAGTGTSVCVYVVVVLLRDTCSKTHPIVQNM